MAKNFFASCMASEDVRSLKYTGIFKNGGALAEIHDGALVVRGAMADHDVYAGLKDPNKFEIAAPTANTAAVDVVDYVGRSKGQIMGVTYADGIKTFGLVAPAGAPVRVRVPRKHDTGYFAADNFATEPTVDQYAIPTANSTLWTPVAAIDTAKTCIKIEFATDVTEGNVSTGKEYFVTFVNVID